MPKQFRITAYFDSEEELKQIKKAAAKVQLRREPNLSQYVSEAVRMRLAQDLKNGKGVGN